MPLGSDAEADQGCRKRRNQVPDWSEIRCRFPPKSPAAFDRNPVPVCSDFCRLCGGAPINHDLLAEFRRENAALLDRLLTQSVTGLIAEKLVTLEELAIKPAPAKAGGTKVRAHAGRGSLSKSKRLESIEKAVAERVAELKSELDTDPAEPERRCKRRALQAAEERARRVKQAQQKLAELEQEKAERAKTHATEEAKKGEPKVSVSDPEARLMRLPDGAAAPAWNVQVATANGFIVEIDPSLPRRRPGIDARTAAPRRDWWKRLPSAVAARRNGCWPIPRR